jgi:hypothetical protein
MTHSTISSRNFKKESLYADFPFFFSIRKENIFYNEIYERILMDSDIRTELKDVGKHLHSIANQVSSTKSSMESIAAMRDCLCEAAKTLDIYLKIQKNRY